MECRENDDLEIPPPIRVFYFVTHNLILYTRGWDRQLDRWSYCIDWGSLESLEVVM